MRGELRVVADCPTDTPALEALLEAARQAGLADLAVTVTVIDTDDQAQGRGFIGSPTFWSTEPTRSRRPGRRRVSPDVSTRPRPDRAARRTSTSSATRCSERVPPQPPKRVADEPVMPSAAHHNLAHLPEPVPGPDREACPGTILDL
jgi:hypothetical protein